MKNKTGIYIIGVDHGYGNIKTANCCFPTGVEGSDTEPTFKNDLLIYQRRYYQIGVGHKQERYKELIYEERKSNCVPGHSPGEKENYGACQEMQLKRE